MFRAFEHACIWSAWFGRATSDRLTDRLGVLHFLKPVLEENSDASFINGRFTNLSESQRSCRMEPSMWPVTSGKYALFRSHGIRCVSPVGCRQVSGRIGWRRNDVDLRDGRELSQPDRRVPSHLERCEKMADKGRNRISNLYSKERQWALFRTFLERL
jgi:hypothetical protein